ncbi:hypothetical protein BAY59_27190 [Prauserella coralliicola]|nr:hypothetical protein BAY59_27190 [Prauserella coralliicola]
MTVFAVRYEYARGSEAERDEHRGDHVAFLRSLNEAGVLRLSGRLEDDAHPGALIVVGAGSAAEVERTLDDDPFWTAGVIATRDVRKWNVVFGEERVAG